MRDREKALDRIRKLLALSRSQNPSEAANAAAAAAKIMAQHGIDSVEEIDPEVDPVTDNLDLAVECGREKKVPIWKWHIAWHVAESAQCRPCTYYRLADRKITAICVAFIGRRSDAELCAYLFSYLVSEIDRLHDEHVPPIGKRIQIYIPGNAPQYVDREHQKTWSRDFRYGAAVAIGDRMKQARRDVVATASSTALVRLDTIVDDVLGLAAKMGLDYVGATVSEIRTRAAYDQGVRAGRQIDLSRDHAALGEGLLKIGPRSDE